MGKWDKQIKCPKCKRKVRSDRLKAHRESRNCLKVNQVKKNSACVIPSCHVHTSKPHLKRHMKKYHPDIKTINKNCPVYGCKGKVSKSHIRGHIVKYHPQFANMSIKQIRSNSKGKSTKNSHQQQQQQPNMAYTNQIKTKRRDESNWAQYSSSSSSSSSQSDLTQYQHDQFILDKHTIIGRGYEVQWIKQRLQTPGNYHIQSNCGYGKTSCVKFCLQNIDHLYLNVLHQSIQQIQQKLKYYSGKIIVLDQYQQSVRFPITEEKIVFTIGNIDLNYTNFRFRPIEYKTYLKYFPNTVISGLQYGQKFQKDLRRIRNEERKKK